jgi:beta-N-acetylhexosaminidase
MKDIRRFTLEEKVGQLFLLGFQGPAPDAEASALIERIRPGGFTFFQRNIEGFDQFHALTDSLREPNGIPALLAIDHEGGRVDRLKHIFGSIPSISELASLGTAYLRAGARIIAAELEATGLNLDFAPVLDLRFDGAIVADRTLGTGAAEVSRLAGAFIDELSKKTIIACGKHFPGLGASRLDTHFVLPKIERSKRQLQQEDAVPFQSLIGELGMIMVAHAHYPGLGDERPVPASLSPRVIDGLLRRRLGFRGVVVTDDLTMGAISSLGLTPDIFLRAFEAGNDMLLFSQTTPLVEEAFKTIVRAVRSSEALRARLDASLDRILLLKTRIHYTPPRYRAHIKARIGRQIDRLRKSLETPSEHTVLLNT